MGRSVLEGLKKLYYRFQLILVLAVTIWLAIVPTGLALEPREILVIANMELSESISLAKYYMKRRGIPENNLITLSVTDKERIDSQTYEKKVASPIREYIKDDDPFRFIRCFVTVYGIPLIVDRPKTPANKAQLASLRKESEILKKQIKDAENHQKRGLQEQLASIREKIVGYQANDSSASLDSEIALVLEKHYTTAGWVPNPYYLGYRGKRIEDLPWDAIMVSRLDAPSAKIVRRLIDDTLLAEKNGLYGKAYFDARWPEPKERKLSGYAFYDQSIHQAASVVQKKTTMHVVLDDKEEIFRPGECPEAALYCGWYSLAKYIDAFTWQPGAIGYHIASSECNTLKKKNSQVWCKKMVEKGVVATLGPVSEPYVAAFPPPALFFALLVKGKLTLVECFAASNPFLSWKIVLIGDPLYRPFKQNFKSISEPKGRL